MRTSSLIASTRRDEAGDVDYETADNVGKITFAILHLRSQYTNQEDVLALDLVLAPFLCHVMGREHKNLATVLTLVDRALWIKLIDKAKLLVAHSMSFSHTFSDDEIENDCFILLEDCHLGCTSIVSTLVSEVILPLLHKLFPTKFVGSKVVNGYTSFRVASVRFIDERRGIDFCHLYPENEYEENEGGVPFGWARYFHDSFKQPLPTRELKDGVVNV